MSDQALNVGDRVQVNDPGLAQLRAIMRRATGQEPPPNHHGVISEVWAKDGDYLIDFDDGCAAPYPFSQVSPLSDSKETQQP